MNRKPTLIALCFLCLVDYVNGQTTTATAPQTTVLGSYRAINDFDVYPYYSIGNSIIPPAPANQAPPAGTPTSAGQLTSGTNLTTPSNLIKIAGFIRPEPYIDPTIHFKIKRGTEFYISKTETLNGTIVGYVIQVWDFDRDTLKNRFYNTLSAGNNANKNQVGRQQSTKSSSKDSEYMVTKSGQGEYPLNTNDTISPYAKYAPLKYVDSWGNDRQFFVSASDFTANSTSVYPSSSKFTWGFLTLPIKVRFDNSANGRFNFEQNLNFGLTLGLKKQIVSHEDVSVNFLVGVSVVNAVLNNATPATAEIPATSTAAAVPAKAASPATSAPAFSISLGSMFQYNRFQIGLFVGKDFVGENSNKFSFQGRNWLGVAIGVSLFGEGQTTAGGQQQHP